MNPGWRKNYIRYKAYFLNVIGRYKDRQDIRGYLELLLSLATISVFSFFALRPTILTIAQLLKDIEAKKTTLAQIDEKIKKLSESQTLYDRERSQINLLLGAIPEKPNPDDFTRQVLGVSAKNQVVTTDIDLTKDAQPVGTSSGGLKNEMTYQIRSASDPKNYSSLVNLLSDFENIRQPSKIDSLQIVLASKDEIKFLVLSVGGKLTFLTKLHK